MEWVTAEEESEPADLGHTESNLSSAASSQCPTEPVMLQHLLNLYPFVEKI